MHRPRPRRIQLVDIQAAGHKLVADKSRAHRGKPPPRDLIVGVTKCERNAACRLRADISRIRLPAPCGRVHDAKRRQA